MKVGDMVKERLGTAIGWVTRVHPLYHEAVWVKWIDPGADNWRGKGECGEPPESLVYKDNLVLVKT